MDDRPRCPLCGSRSFHVRDDGLTWCSNEHQQEGGPAIGDDEDNFNQRGRVVRKKEVKQEKASRVLRGVKAFRLYLQAWQFLLWKQCYALVHQKELPPELWNVVRELWSLRLDRLAVRLVEDDAAEKSDKKEISDTVRMGEASEAVEESDQQRNKNGNPATNNPTLIETIALNYLAMILLRLPIGVAQYFEWVQCEDVPYIRAIRHIPPEIKDRLPGTYHAALDTQTILQSSALQDAVYRVVSMYHTTFGMAIPASNHILLLVSYAKELALPIEVISAVQRLNTIVKFDFKFLFKPRTNTTPLNYPEVQLLSLLVIATKLLFPFRSAELENPNTKNHRRLSQLVFNWEKWLQSRDTEEQRPDERPGKENKMEVTDKDVFKMTDDQLDEYMDWYQRMWIQPTNAEGISKQILDMFPLKDIPDLTTQQSIKAKSRSDGETARARDQRTISRVKGMQSCLTYVEGTNQNEPGNDEDISFHKPDLQYQRFLSVADMDVPTPESSNVSLRAARAFHEDVGRLACLSLEKLLRAVNQTEQKLMIWQRAKRRAEYWGESDIDLDAEMRGRRCDRGKGEGFDSAADTTDLEEDGDDDDDDDDDDGTSHTAKPIDTEMNDV